MIKDRFTLRIFITGYLLLLSFLSFGQEDENDNIEKFSLNSPYASLQTHLGHLQEDNYFPRIAAQPFLQEGINQDQAVEYAVKLKQVLDGSGIYIDMEEVPAQNTYTDSISGKQRYYLSRTDFPQVYLERENGNWVYSDRTIEVIDELHNQVYGSDILLDLLPRMGQKEVWGLHLWQHFAILIIIIMAFSIYKLLNYVFERLISQTLARFNYTDIAKNFIRPIAKPFSILVVFLLIRFFIPLVQLPPSVAQYIVLGLRGIWPIFATAIFYHLVDIFGMYLQRIADKTESTLDDQLVPLIRKSLKAFVIVVGGLFILQNLKFDVTALLAGLSIGGLAFALAAQDTIKNFFGSLMIFVDKPFQVGDWVTSGDIDGTVEEVGFRSTRVRTFRNSVTYVPNGKMADSVIDNHGLRQFRRFYTQLAVTYDTPPALIELFVEGLTKIVENHPYTRKDFYNIYLNDLASHSLNIMFYVFFKVPTWTEELRCRHEIILNIIKLAETLGVRFAFPTQTLHMETFPEKKSLSPDYQTDMSKLRKKMEDFLANGKSNQEQVKDKKSQ